MRYIFIPFILFIASNTFNSDPDERVKIFQNTYSRLLHSSPHSMWMSMEYDMEMETRDNNPFFTIHLIQNFWCSQIKVFNRIFPFFLQKLNFCNVIRKIPFYVNLRSLPTLIYVLGLSCSWCCLYARHNTSGSAVFIFSRQEGRTHSTMIPFDSLATFN